MKQFHSFWQKVSQELNPQKEESESKGEPATIKAAQAISTGFTHQASFFLPRYRSRLTDTSVPRVPVTWAFDLLNASFPNDISADNHFGL